jgi:hypothetical protein
VWCAVYSHGILGLYFYENAEGHTVTDTERYKVMLETFLPIELNPLQQDLLCFQQDGAPAHTAQISMQVVRTVFLGRHISRYEEIIWPACLPDHVVSHCFLWDYIKSKVYETHPAIIADLKQRILECIQGIPKEMLCVMSAFPSRLQECTEQHGGHLQSVIFKQ